MNLGAPMCSGGPATLAASRFVIPDPGGAKFGDDGQHQQSVLPEQHHTTTAMVAIPPKPVSRTVTQSGNVNVSAPIGGTLMIAGHQVNVIAANESSITYTAN